MSGRTLYHVAPEGLGWLVTIPGDSVEELKPTRAEAIARATELARSVPSARVIVTGIDGSVEQVLDVDGASRST